MPEEVLRATLSVRSIQLAERCSQSLQLDSCVSDSLEEDLNFSRWAQGLPMVRTATNGRCVSSVVQAFTMVMRAPFGAAKTMAPSIMFIVETTLDNKRRFGQRASDYD